MAVAAVALGACGGDSPMEDELGACEAVLDLFPVPVGGGTSPFGEIDDEFLAVAFFPGFTFSFYGAQYPTVYLNTNGGMTFGAGDNEFDRAAYDVLQPGIAVFWGDLDAARTTASDQRANQMTYQLCTDRFIVRYQQLQDHNEDTWNNTATVTLEANGRIVIEYGAVLSEEILVGVFDGTHTDDRYLALQNGYLGYSQWATASSCSTTTGWARITLASSRAGRSPSTHRQDLGPSLARSAETAHIFCLRSNPNREIA